jgi:hypothetical protein
MVGDNPPMMWGFLGWIRIGYSTNMCGRIRISIRRAYFYGRHVNPV